MVGAVVCGTLGVQLATGAHPLVQAQPQGFLTHLKDDSHYKRNDPKSIKKICSPVKTRHLVGKQDTGSIKLAWSS